MLFILMVAAFVVPGVLQTIDNLQLRSSAGALVGMMQEARMLAAKRNATYTIGYTAARGARIAFIDLNNDGVWQASEPMVQLSGSVDISASVPTGSSGQPTAYVLAGDSGSGGPYTNGSILVANLFDSKGNPIASGAPGVPSITWNGGGNATIQYDSCWMSAMSQSFPLQFVAEREMMYSPTRSGPSSFKESSRLSSKILRPVRLALFAQTKSLPAAMRKRNVGLRGQFPAALCLSLFPCLGLY